MTILAPARMRGQVMGLWFCASALGKLSRRFKWVEIFVPDKLDVMPDFFSHVSIACIGYLCRCSCSINYSCA